MNLYVIIGRVLYWVGWPVSWLYLRGSHRSRLLLVCGDELLVVQGWLGVGRWVLPGGGLKQNEDPIKGTLREVTEETGVRLKPGDLTLLTDEPYRLYGFRYRCKFYAAQVSTKPPVRAQRYEIVAIGWTKFRDVSARTHSRDVLRALELWTALNTSDTIKDKS